MATTFDQPSNSSSVLPSTANPLNSVLARVYTINWEVAFYIVLLVIAVLTRFVNLGDRVMSHDESLHVKYSDELYREGRFAHTPLMHGPLLFHVTALDFFLFGDTDFAGRIYPAVLGIIMIFLPRLMFGKWMGKWGAAVAGILITISPQLLFHARYIREDTPAIFFSMLMAYSIFAYLDGVKPRQIRFLVLFAAATLLNLASKETAFMYIAVFGLVLILFLLFQLAQAWRRNLISPVIGNAAIGAVVIPAMSVVSALAVVYFRTRNNYVTPATLKFGNIDQLGNAQFAISGNVISTFYMAIVGIPLAIMLSIAAIYVVRFIFKIVRRPVEGIVHYAADEGNSLMQIILAGVIIGTIAALTMTAILTIIPPEKIDMARQSWTAYDATVADHAANPQPGQAAPIVPGISRPDAMIFRLLLWSGVLTLVLVGAVIGTAVARFSRLPHLPWRDIALIVTVAILSCAVLLYVEEKGRTTPNVSEDARKNSTAPYDNNWIDATWVLGGAAVAGILVLRLRTNFFREMSRFGVWDLVIVVGTLVLPWTAALPIFKAGYPLDTSSYNPQLVEACLLGIIPFIGVSITLGLAWSFGAWLLTAGAFYSLFAFFYTTIFTNAQGVATGIIGSLGYWLVQQGVKRADQPQYYYTLIQVPIYEYLGLIGSLCAGVYGLSLLWKWRAARIEERLLVASAANSDVAADGAIYASNDQLSEDEQANTTEESYAQQTMLSELNRTSEMALPSSEAQSVDENVLETSDEPVALTDDPELISDALRDNGRIDLFERVERIPFVAFMGIWLVLITMALTIAGEKMPWLTTHIALPMTFVAGWYIGSLLERVNWSNFFKQSWLLIVLIPLFIVGLANVIGPFFLGKSPFAGLTRGDLLLTFAWLGAVLLAGLVGWGVFRIWRSIGTTQTIRVALVGMFVFIGILTTRTAFTAAYINYDFPTEYIGYAHGGPGNKTALAYLEEISRRTTDGMSIRFGYDDRMSWPGAWYFRNFPNGQYLGPVSSIANPEQYVVVMVSTDNAQKIDAQMADNFERFDLMRLWWPMEDYKNLSIQRVDEAFGDAKWRNAMWEIWFNRDYKPFAIAMDPNNPTRFDLDKWPVNDRMAMYIRKDIAAQLWDLGVGGAKVTGLPSDPFANLRCDTCAASTVITNPTENPLSAPRDVTIGADGRMYLADSRNGRIVIYNSNGVFQRAFGVPSTGDVNTVAPIGTLREPWSVAVDNEGLIYVADTWNHRVQVFTNDGKPLRNWGKFESVPAGTTGAVDGFYGPRDIKIDSQENIYVADTGNKRVRVYTSTGTFKFDIGAADGAPGALREPVGIAINEATQEIYIASTWNKEIDVYSLSGQYLRSWKVRAWAATTDSQDSGNRPYLALDRTGRYLFVTDPDVARVLVYDTQGNPILSFGRLGSEPYGLNNFGVLGGMKVDPKTGALLLVDAGSGRILRFEAGTLPGLVGQTGAIADVVGSPITPSPVTGEAIGTQPGTDNTTQNATEPATAVPTQDATSSGF